MDRPRVRGRRPGIIKAPVFPLIAVATFCAVTLAILGGNLLPSEQPFSSDEGLHAMWALSMANDLRTHRLDAFWRDLNRQGRWPPLGAMLQLPVILCAAPAPQMHRIAILLMLPLALIPLWFLGGLLAPNRAWEPVAGMAACLLALTSPGLLAVACRAMLEVPCIGLSYAAYACYLIAVTSKRPRVLLPGGFLLVGAFFCKWQYGALTTLVTFADLLIRTGPRPMAILRDRSTWRFYGPSIVTLGLWMSNPVHARDFLLYATWGNSGVQFLTQETIRFWLRLCWWYYNAGPVPSCLCALGFLLAFGRLRSPAWRVILLHTTLAYLINAMRPSTATHMGLWFGSGMWILGAGGLTWTLARLSRTVTALPRVAPALVAAGFAVAWCATVSLILPPVVRDAPSWQIYDWIRDHAHPSERIVTVGAWTGILNPYSLQWRYMARDGISYEDLSLEEWPPPERPRQGVHWRLPWQIRKARVNTFESLRPLEQLQVARTSALFLVRSRDNPLNPEDQPMADILGPDSRWQVVDQWEHGLGGDVRLLRKIGPPRGE